LLVAFVWGRCNVSSLCRHLDEAGFSHRSRFNNFLLVGRWQPEALLARKAHELLSRLQPRKGDVVELILDDSKKEKRGKEMDAVGWIHDPVSGRSIRGHLYVKATLRFRGHTIPFGIRLYVKEEECEDLAVSFRKTTLLAADLIAAFDPPPGVKVRVLFDCYYLCPVVVNACREKGFRFVSTLKSNRNLFKNGRKLKAGNYGKNLFARTKKKRFFVQKGKASVGYQYVDAQWMDVSTLGRLHVLFSRKNKDRKVLGIVTDDCTLTGAQMIKAYDERWSIEVFF
ncbi:MAG: transposase, partial [Bdellovibrionota bacterium]